MKAHATRSDIYGEKVFYPPDTDIAATTLAAEGARVGMGLRVICHYTVDTPTVQLQRF